MLETLTYVRKPFEVDAVLVTAENMSEVAAWCKGEVKTAKAPHIKVPVNRAINERQRQAFAGDYVLFAKGPNGGFKVYTPKAFANSFEQVSVGTTIQETGTETVETPVVVAVVAP